jgi:hypothetical protein
MPARLRICLSVLLLITLSISVAAQRTGRRRTAPAPEKKTFTREDLIRSQTDLARLQYFGPDVQFVANDSTAAPTVFEKKDSLITNKKTVVVDCRETKALNKSNVADAYPFISGDGLRLYFTSNREGGHGRFFISRRKTVSDPFDEPIVLSKHLTDGYYAGTLTANELELCMSKSGSVYISKRNNLQSEFGEPVPIKGIKKGYDFGPAISPDGNEIILTSLVSNGKTVRIYKKIEDGMFVDAGELPIPKESVPGPGQFSKDGLSYYFSFEDNENKVSLWRYSRISVNSGFVDLEKLPVKINALQRNFQPTVNNDASIFVYTTSQNNLWEEDDLVLVNDPKMQLADREQFASIVKNNTNTLAVLGKVITPQIRTFPNPFQNDIIVEMSQAPADGTSFLLYDLGGKLIKQLQLVNSKTTIPLGNLPSATYIYQVIDNNRKLIASGKLVRG